MNKLCQQVTEMKIVTGNCEESAVIKYDSMYVTPWAVSYDYEQRHRSILQKIQAWIESEDVLATLGFFIVALNTDFVRVSKRSYIEGIQYKFVNLLRKYLNVKYKNDREKANKKLAQLIDLIPLAREAAEIAMTKKLNFI